MKETYIYWQSLKSDFMEHIKRSDLKPRCYTEFNSSMDKLFEYAAMNGFTEYSPQIGYAFWENEKSQGASQPTLARRRRTIKKLNLFLYGQIYWQVAPRSLRKYKSSHEPLKCPEQFSDAFEGFLQFLKHDGLKEITIELYRDYCIRHILCVLAQDGVESWQGIGAKNLTDAFVQATNKVKFATFSRRLFGYLLASGVVSTDYSVVLPLVTKPKTVPSVYSEEEIQRLLSSIETITPQGKRDYTMVLIAVRLGLRVSDISRLQFDNIDFDNSIIKFVQFKTSVPHQLPLPAEVAEAILDYTMNGREDSDEPYVFLDGYGKPLPGHAVGHIGSRHLKRAGIEIGERHAGMHALRMSFASQLVQEKIPYDVVRYALGHVNPNSTRHYVQFALESLRACCLEVPPPSGLLKKYLEGGL